eukprot:1638302-Rhodomonas_salina.3
MGRLVPGKPQAWLDWYLSNQSPRLMWVDQYPQNHNRAQIWVDLYPGNAVGIEVLAVGVDALLLAPGAHHPCRPHHPVALPGPRPRCTRAHPRERLRTRCACPVSARQGFRVQGLGLVDGFRVQGAGSRVDGFRVQGPGFK